MNETGEPREFPSFDELDDEAKIRLLGELLERDYKREKKTKSMSAYFHELGWGDSFKPGNLTPEFEDSLTGLGKSYFIRDALPEEVQEKHEESKTDRS